jgi:hypothetical protein
MDQQKDDLEEQLIKLCTKYKNEKLTLEEMIEIRD